MEVFEIIKAPHIYNAEIYHRAKDIIAEIKPSLDRFGHVIMTDIDALSAVKRAESIVSKLQFKTTE